MRRMIEVTNKADGKSFAVGIAHIAGLEPMEDGGTKVITTLLINQVIEGSQVRMIYAAHEVMEDYANLYGIINA